MTTFVPGTCIRGAQTADLPTHMYIPLGAKHQEHQSAFISACIQMKYVSFL